jgi:hypothetical protein
LKIKEKIIDPQEKIRLERIEKMNKFLEDFNKKDIAKKRGSERKI